MKNAESILSAIISRMPANKRPITRAILESRFLAQNSAQETAEYLNLPYPVVVSVLQDIRKITRGMNPADFA